MSNELKQDLTFEGITCPVCGGKTFGEYPGPKTIFRCTNPRPNGDPCPGVVCKCAGCNTVYTSENFGKHGDVYECKTCGRVQWDYTELKRTDDMIASIHNRLSHFSF